MMLLADVGNSGLKWAWWRDGVLAAHGAVRHAGAPLEQALSRAWAELPRPSRLVAANVAGAGAAAALKRYSEERFGLTPEFIVPSAQALGVVNAYPEPAQLGADRWAALVGAFHRHGGPLAVFGCGTALTADSVTADGRHQGGLITAGVATMQRALAASTAALGLEPGEALALHACDTRVALASGTTYAAAAFIEWVAEHLAREQGAELKLLLYGGEASRLQPLLSERYTLAPYLVLEGLALLAGADC